MLYISWGKLIFILRYEYKKEWLKLIEYLMKVFI